MVTAGMTEPGFPFIVNYKTALSKKETPKKINFKLKKSTARETLLNITPTREIHQGENTAQTFGTRNGTNSISSGQLG